MIIIRLIFLIISLSGYFLHLKRKIDIKEEFLPVIIITMIGIIEYIAGILNLLKTTAFLIGIIGVVLFSKNLYEILKNKEKIKFNKNIIFFVLIIIWSFYILKGNLLTSYDNFSHWAMIIREMNITNKLPNFESSMILFQSYPPGTACIAYFICKYLGKSETIMALGQCILILSSLYTIFVFCKKENKINYIITLSTIAYILVNNIFITDLLVDTVLSVMGLAGIVIILYYNEDSKKGLCSSIPILTLLMLVKNSGIFFVVIDLLVWFILFVKNNGVRTIFKTKYLILVLLPIIAQVLWTTHIDLVFSNAKISKHSMSIENYSSVIKEKENSNIYSILNHMKEKMTDIKDEDNQILLLIMLTFIFMIIISRKNKELKKFIIKMMCLCIFIYITYQISLFGMYIFSMSLEEALNLAAYSRYFKTVVSFEFGICVIAVLYFINDFLILKDFRNYIVKFILIISTLIPLLLYNDNLYKLYKKRDFTDSTRSLILNYKNIYNIEEQKSYLIYVSNGFNEVDGYVYFVGRYDFKSDSVKVIKNFSELETMDEIFIYDYFIILEKDDEIIKFLDRINGDVESNVIKIR